MCPAISKSGHKPDFNAEKNNPPPPPLPPPIALCLICSIAPTTSIHLCYRSSRQPNPPVASTLCDSPTRVDNLETGLSRNQTRMMDGFTAQ